MKVRISKLYNTHSERLQEVIADGNPNKLREPVLVGEHLLFYFQRGIMPDEIEVILVDSESTQSLSISIDPLENERGFEPVVEL